MGKGEFMKTLSKSRKESLVWTCLEMRYEWPDSQKK